MTHENGILTLKVLASVGRIFGGFLCEAGFGSAGGLGEFRRVSVSHNVCTGIATRFKPSEGEGGANVAPTTDYRSGGRPSAGGVCLGSWLTRRNPRHPFKPLLQPKRVRGFPMFGPLRVRH